MPTEKRKLGNLGEKVAKEYLQSKGYEIQGENYLKPWGEIDIIAKKDNVLIFVEVKTKIKKTEKQGYLSPEANIGRLKGIKLIRTAETYLMEKNIPENVFWRIDVISVELDYAVRKAKVKHFEDAIVG